MISRRTRHLRDKESASFHYYRKVLKQIPVGDLQPEETVDAVREARLLAKVGAHDYCMRLSSRSCDSFSEYSWTIPTLSSSMTASWMLNSSASSQSFVR